MREREKIEKKMREMTRTTGDCKWRQNVNVSFCHTPGMSSFVEVSALVLHGCWIYETDVQRVHIACVLHVVALSVLIVLEE